MAGEPNAIKELLDALDSRVSKDTWAKLQKELAEVLKARERVEGIVQLCYLDGALERLLRTVMIEDESVVKELMKDGQPLQPFSIKLKLAYALGLIPELVRRDLYFLNKVRNAFAHEAKVTSFDEKPVCDYCRELSTAKQIDGKARPPRDAHDVAVVDSLLFLELEIDWRVREEESHQSQPGDSVESRYAAYVGAGIISRKKLP